VSAPEFDPEEIHNMDDLGAGIEEGVTIIWDNTTDIVARLRKAADRSATLGERFRALGEVMDAISQFQHAAAVEAARLGAEAIAAERLSFDDDEPEEEEEESEDA
jgi:hypothetical protein